MLHHDHITDSQALLNVRDPAPAPTYRIALGPRAGRKVLSLQYAASRAAPMIQPLCANAHGFSLPAGVRCAAEQRSELEHLCRYITRPAIANERQLQRNATVSSGWGPACGSGKPSGRFQSEAVMRPQDLRGLHVAACCRLPIAQNFLKSGHCLSARVATITNDSDYFVIPADLMTSSQR